MAQVDVDVDENIIEPIKLNQLSVAIIACFVAEILREESGSIKEF